MKCGNCNIEMQKTKDPIIFGYPRLRRTRWKCPRCGADIPRTPDEGELDEKSTTYVLTQDEIDKWRGV